MTAARKRSLIHATLAAAALAGVGAMYAELAGLWVAGQPVPRDGPPTTTPPPDVSALLRWRLPAAMAAVGFLIVLLGEGLAALWKKPAPPAAPAGRDFDREAEAKIQQMLKEGEPKPGPAGGVPTDPGAPAP